MPLFIGSEVYRGSSYGPAHPLRVPRVSTVMDLCRALGWLPAAQYRASPRAKPAALARWHTPEYVAALQQAEAEGAVTDAIRARHHLGTLSNPVFAQVFSRPATGAGGVMLAAELLATGTSAVHVPGGGTHHGLPDRANGFCYLNDPVLAVLALRRAGMARVAYVDIDAHHCDGVQHGFAGDPQTLLISTHEEGRWPFSGALEDDGGGNCVNLPLPRGLNDTDMRAVLDAVILPQVQAHRPDVIVLQAGADSLGEDPLSRLSLSNRAYIGVLRALLPLAPRLLLLGGGGYNPWSVGRCWTALWATLAGHDIPDQLPDEAQAILRALSWGGGGRPPPAPHLLTTLLDPAREGPVSPDLRPRIAHLAQRLRA
ncbi:acetoin utilization protein AcuC [Pseudotabrizicola alkalilacus]|uniref:Acetoin utilization protein AcuC n=1 Tax=Pseudotabrizicola alkalilacus TaxID=2305252 RepID=A0A411Z2B6_9RHOB|nr:acetoin utilization protein AcuC [Pseudotabrizicola alkalilacus]RGP37208.1 acetoin utilization protein AcuC [Pseudotabrizicola alkalilacus]